MKTYNDGSLGARSRVREISPTETDYGGAGGRRFWMVMQDCKRSCVVALYIIC